MKRWPVATFRAGTLQWEGDGQFYPRVEIITTSGWAEQEGAEGMARDMVEILKRKLEPKK